MSGLDFLSTFCFVLNSTLLLFPPNIFDGKLAPKGQKKPPTLESKVGGFLGGIRVKLKTLLQFEAEPYVTQTGLFPGFHRVESQLRENTLD